MNPLFSGPARAIAAWAAAVAAALCLASCVVATPPPSPPAVFEPAGIPGSVSSAEWDIAAVAYAEAGPGLDYSRAGLAPVLIVFRNRGGRSPLVDPAEVLGLAPGGQYAPYPPYQAVDVAEATTAFDESAKAALRGGAAGAIIGAGLGTLFGAMVGGGDALWQGALIGGGIGAFTGAATSLPEARYQLRRDMEADLSCLALRPVPVAPFGLMAGYVYFPSGMGIGWVRLTVRVEGEAFSYELPIAPPPFPVSGRPAPPPPAF
ncbi:hypothetical protein [Desulfolutivibrio sulfoxidireducens]|uniref:hypothetical protein n=1 Tax=Desulfolutivibrio sulfoxidireducens TaxID=2773299 RepID=UPI00159E38BC|nr:hypothetical protein [Desulfolutivibrio sulfoxidireducens]QLA16883.1 hypothetical protein GD605_12685 [Desulfolutivibrio sulfoxidireducens]QLA20449.1 hypothetical protein GD604_12395 [Desulfolutivibrio sulfoxidireducens]